MRTAPPSLPDISDEEMVDAPPSRDPSAEVETAENQDDGPDVEPEPEQDPEAEPEQVQAQEQGQGQDPDQDQKQGQEQEGAEETGEAQPESNAEPKPEGVSSPAVQDEDTPSKFSGTPRGGGHLAGYPRKRRPGRPPKNPRPEWDLPDDGSEQKIVVTTPVKRRRGRPAASGGRWGRRGGYPHVTQVAVDKEGTMMDVVNDEVALPDIEEGEKKVDKMGRLLGGREYRVRTFTILNRGERLYMLSTEPARCIGFRDSYLFFQKHKMLYKIIIDDDAKRDLIERDIIPHSYKGRAIGVVTARSVFREFGARIVIGGRKVIDDYDEKAALERGDVEGELAVPEDRLPPPGEPYNRNQYVAWHGASAVYHTGAPSVPLPVGKAVDPKKRKVAVTGDNWMIEHAREASRFNSVLANVRRENLEGVYDVHTNYMQYPKIMQPTHARWERVAPSDDSKPSNQLVEDMSALQLISDNTPRTDDDDGVDNNNENATESTGKQSSQTTPAASILPPVPEIFTRRFAIADIVYETPETSTLGRPGPDGDVQDVGYNGIISMANPQYPEFVSPEIFAELPPECKEALVEAAMKEYTWKSKWRTESTDGLRGQFLQSYNWHP
ncbi:nuclear localization protein NPL6, putative [Talaromyces stipitatus ATCC 10500]|uniref:Nuclear localization protein NPL6, putative n=1 Tax=Talaromyces stipitatus (strain ATCC 10500 / CBS 375.48 / QM 6759 / NRRL 1006) TaxID=441959 RepID=B8M6Q1_TALSN|nr:nuclear localization protein NPL6, putative [Talaromyces stipitatus ATCC 10500]EED19513.1 nuclear localization protein NPL6, putative [Talaromyces stipitatus ATCC 10500]